MMLASVRFLRERAAAAAYFSGKGRSLGLASQDRPTRDREGLA